MPRGQHPNPLRDRNAAVTAMISDHLKGNSRAQVVDFLEGSAGGLVQADGSISHHDMYDYLHLTQKGYEKAFEQVRTTYRVALHVVPNLRLT